MVTKKILVWLLPAFLLIATDAYSIETGEYYYAIEQNGTVCGYAHVLLQDADFDGRPAVQLIDSLWIQLSALGKPIEGQYRFEYRLDPETGKYFYHSSRINQASMKLSAVMEVHRDTMLVMSDEDNDTTKVALPPGTILQNTRLFPYLLNYFVKDTLTEMECQVFSEIDSKLNTVLFSNLGRERLKLAGEEYDALKVKSLNRTTGIQVEIWIDPASGLLLKTVHPFRSVYLTDSGIRKKMERADLNEHILSPVGVIISNPWAISYMKLKAKLQPGGMWVTPENLNVRGQKFQGTVEDNLIDGVFEISHNRYDGTNAPPFPHDFSADTSLEKYLKSADFIESDDPAIVKKAEEIAAGATDAWDAATRLSRWVNKEISYDIPGGGTAKKTFETRLGECGSHANLLAAFCRAVGIPARCVFGCMYVPEHGGVMGQHAWNEIYMGDAGWIPVDCTADEVTYADCGHVRIGEWVSAAVMLNPDKMEILDYRVGEGTYADLIKSSGQQYDLYVGKYRGPDKVLTVLKKENRLALDIPGQMVFDLKDPDSSGEWFFVLTDRASVSFETDTTGSAIRMTINSRQRLPRGTETDSVVLDESIPDRYRPLLGDYSIPMQNASFVIAYDDDALSLLFPGNHKIVLDETEAEGQWIGDTGKSKLLITFDRDDSGRASAMRFSELVTCPKIGSPESD